MSDLIKEYEEKLAKADELLASYDDNLDDLDTTKEPSLNQRELEMVEKLIEIEVEAYRSKMALLEGFKDILTNAIEEENENQNTEDEKDFLCSQLDL